MKLAIAILAASISAGASAQVELRKINADVLLCDELTFNTTTGEVIDKQQSLILDAGDRFMAISGESGAFVDSGTLIRSSLSGDWIQEPVYRPDYKPGSEPTVVKKGNDLEGVYTYALFPAVYVEWDCRK